jgi:hypothetical protein
VARLRKARNRIRRVPPEVLKAAKAARDRGLSLRAISAELARKGHLSPSRKPYGPQSIKRMLKR